MHMNFQLMLCAIEIIYLLTYLLQNRVTIQSVIVVVGVLASACLTRYIPHDTLALQSAVVSDIVTFKYVRCHAGLTYIINI